MRMKQRLRKFHKLHLLKVFSLTIINLSNFATVSKTAVTCLVLCFAGTKGIFLNNLQSLPNAVIGKFWEGNAFIYALNPGYFYRGLQALPTTLVTTSTFREVFISNWTNVIWFVIEFINAIVGFTYHLKHEISINTYLNKIIIN